MIRKFLLCTLFAGAIGITGGGTLFSNPVGAQALSTAAEMSFLHNIVPVTPANMKEMLDPSVNAPGKVVYVLSCDATESSCLRQLEGFAMTAAKARGGFLGADLVQARFYFLDTSAVNLKQLSQICQGWERADTSHAPAGSSVCDAYQYRQPIGFLYTVDGQRSLQEFPANEDTTTTLTRFSRQ
jgi:hypothetical protein